MPTPTARKPDGRLKAEVAVGVLEPCLAEANYFLKQLGPGESFTFQTLGDKGEKHLAKVFHGTFDQHAEDLVKLNLQGAGVFVMINEGDGIVLPGRETCRTARNVKRVRALFVDLDGAPIKPVFECKLPPDVVVESSPERYHAYWLGSGIKLEEFKLLQEKLARKFNADPSVKDLPRVMRLPGFLHHKNAAFMTRILKPKRNVQ